MVVTGKCCITFAGMVQGFSRQVRQGQKALSLSAYFPSKIRTPSIVCKDVVLVLLYIKFVLLIGVVAGNCGFGFVAFWNSL